HRPLRAAARRRPPDHGGRDGGRGDGAGQGRTGERDDRPVVAADRPARVRRARHPRWLLAGPPAPGRRARLLRPTILRATERAGGPAPAGPPSRSLLLRRRELVVDHVLEVLV